MAIAASSWQRSTYNVLLSLVTPPASYLSWSKSNLSCPSSSSLWWCRNKWRHHSTTGAHTTNTTNISYYYLQARADNIREWSARSTFTAFREIIHCSIPECGVSTRPISRSLWYAEHQRRNKSFYKFHHWTTPELVSLKVAYPPCSKEIRSTKAKFSSQSFLTRIQSSKVNDSFFIRNKLASLEATLVWNYDRLTHKGKV